MLVQRIEIPAKPMDMSQGLYERFCTKIELLQEPSSDLSVIFEPEEVRELQSAEARTQELQFLVSQLTMPNF